MILKPEDMQAVCDNFINLVFQKAWDQFENWVAEEICPAQTAMHGSPHFVRERRSWPAHGVGSMRLLVSSMTDKFDAEYDKMRQMVEVEGNYYQYWVRDAIATGQTWTDVTVLLPEQSLAFLWAVNSPGDRTLSDADILKFQTKHKIALDYFKRRMTFYSLGVGKGLL